MWGHDTIIAACVAFGGVGLAVWKDIRIRKLTELYERQKQEDQKKKEDDHERSERLDRSNAHELAVIEMAVENVPKMMMEYLKLLQSALFEANQRLVQGGQQPVALMPGAPPDTIAPQLAQIKEETK